MIRSRSKGFSLLELMVVISIIGLLSSIVLAVVAQARTRARDAKRIEQIHQTDLAIELYTAAKGHAPDLQGLCPISNSLSGGPAPCIAISNSTNPNASRAWTNLKADLQPYISSMPDDPCGTSCTNLGYTYVAPPAVRWECSNTPSLCSTNNVTSNTYQIYAPLEQSVVPTGISQVGTFFTPPLSTGHGYY